MEYKKLIFEPHGGFGGFIDDEPMPFGYLSADDNPGGIKEPVFEINDMSGCKNQADYNELVELIETLVLRFNEGELAK